MAEGEARPALQGHYGITREELDELNDVSDGSGLVGAVRVTCPHAWPSRGRRAFRSCCHCL